MFLDVQSSEVVVPSAIRRRWNFMRRRDHEVGAAPK